jgi:hypothetical protein
MYIKLKLMPTKSTVILFFDYFSSFFTGELPPLPKNTSLGTTINLSKQEKGFCV